ncbi:MAG: hypothetical protein COV91_05100 [Candidatus Taylorbacteria bacterium CG11_big_fil_rev_8_21_14_0_20_46_11]|uniref:DUF11 domain-containing protein n=1 Tax=Candidatus Taylorbacteria bacterium CG11_big_fil_rev_8_21_14_0_20_46_11 TaxID=1975025 RepID=A0A2H0KCY3_9BACT|nr:MAG: hypothetical protein COV91_05100 [Candidatus Taylorbacteria bacterium CG11_big_fil_rev_8_21_14_0_20_46_11]
MSSEPNPPESERSSNLENLENRLYSRTPPPLHPPAEFGKDERHIRIAPGWTAEAERKDSAVYGMVARIMPWLKRLFVASILFMLGAGGVALYGFWQGSNMVSSENISLSVLGPVAAPAGEELILDINIGNYNSLLLESVDLIVEYPEGTRQPTDVSASLLRYREALGPLDPSGTLTRRLSLIPFGEEGDAKTIHVTIEYRPKDSNAIFSRKSDYEFVINAAPVTANVTVPKEINSGQVFEVKVEVVSNASSVIKNLIVKAEYPIGFQFSESSPTAAFSKDIWYLGDLKAGAKRTISVKGRIDAVEEEERTFRFSVGTQSPKDEKVMGTVFLSEAPTVTVKRPFVSLDMLVNGERGKTFISKGTGPLRADIVWQNNLPVKIADMEVSVVFEGSIFSRTSVEQGTGFYDSNTSSIVWDKRTQNFGAIAPGQNGSLNFSFSLFPVATDPSLYKNPSMLVHVTVKGKRLDENGAYQEVVSSFTKEIRVATSLALSTDLLHSTGRFIDQGVVPPKAEALTTYTVVWSLSNSSSGVADTKVTAVLPPYVTWLSQVSPASESVTYNPIGGVVTWNTGNLDAGVGFGKAPREVSFQVSFLPSISQIGSTPVIVGEATATADDRFTGILVKSNVRPPLTTASLSLGGGPVTVQ